MMTDIAFYMTSAVGIGITVGIVQAIKKAGLASKWLPLVSIGVGVVYGAIASVTAGFSVWVGVLWGLLISTMGSTGYDTVKGFTKGKK